jgi:hypothetical protein
VGYQVGGAVELSKGDEGWTQYGNQQEDETHDT